MPFRVELKRAYPAIRSTDPSRCFGAGEAFTCVASTYTSQPNICVLSISTLTAASVVASVDPPRCALPGKSCDTHQDLRHRLGQQPSHIGQRSGAPDRKAGLCQNPASRVQQRHIVSIQQDLGSKNISAPGRGSTHPSTYTHRPLGQIAGCNRLHSAEERLSRWLLTAFDRAGTEILEFTKEFLAQMLVARRTTVTLVAGILQSSGLITYERGRIRILSRDRLESAACTCYGILHQMHIGLYRNPVL